MVERNGEKTRARGFREDRFAGSGDGLTPAAASETPRDRVHRLSNDAEENKPPPLARSARKLSSGRERCWTLPRITEGDVAGWFYGVRRRRLLSFEPSLWQRL